MIRIVLADDHAAVRIGFRMVLDAQPDMHVLGEAADGQAALSQVREHRPDVLLADLRMPRMDGLELTRRVTDPREGLNTRVVVVTTFDDEDDVVQALTDGASGFLLKRSGPALLVEAVRAAANGATLISPDLTVPLLRRWPRSETREADRVELTAREREVAALVAHGLTNAEVAHRLFISSGTVKTHVAAIQQKLGARNRVGIAAWAWRTRAAEQTRPEDR